MGTPPSAPIEECIGLRAIRADRRPTLVTSHLRLYYASPHFELDFPRPSGRPFYQHLSAQQTLRPIRLLEPPSRLTGSPSMLHPN